MTGQSMLEVVNLIQQGELTKDLLKDESVFNSVFELIKAVQGAERVIYGNGLINRG